MLPATLNLTDSAISSPQSIPLTGAGIPIEIIFADNIHVTDSPGANQAIFAGGANGILEGIHVLDTASAKIISQRLIFAEVIHVLDSPFANPEISVGGPDGVAESIHVIDTPSVVACPFAALSVTAVSGGSQGIGTSTAAGTVNLSNPCASTLSFSAPPISITGPGAQSWRVLFSCTPTLNPNSACGAIVYFDPVAAGPQMATLSFSDSATNPQQVSLSGTGVTPSLNISPQSLALAFGSINVGSVSTSQTVTITNSGTVGLFLGNFTITGANPGSFSFVNNNCGGPAGLPPGQSCTVSVTFAPTAVGSLTATLNIVDYASGAPQQITLSGTGTAANDTLTPATLSFGNVSLNSRSDGQLVTVTNTGTQTLTVSGVTITGANASSYSVTNNNCGPRLPGTQCTITVVFTPGAGAALADDSNFLTLADRDLLNRPANTTADTNYIPELAAAAISPQSVALTILGTSEYRTDLINSYYQAYLGRPADQAGLANFLNYMQSGGTDQGVQAQILSSPEFFADQGSTNVGFVDALYTELLQRAADSGATPLINGLANGSLSRAQVATQILDSGEYEGDLVKAWYSQFLGRVPSAGELTNWLTDLSAGAANEHVIADLVGSAEFFALAQNGAGAPLGPLTATLNVFDNAVGSPQTVGLTGTSLLGPVDNTSSSLVTNTAFVKNHVTGVYSGTLTVKNTGSLGFGLPLYVVLENLPAGVTSTNSTGTAILGGGPYWSLGSPLGPGQSQSFPVTFTDPGNAAITFSPRVYSGPVQ
jgi:hypothetical protein